MINLNTLDTLIAVVTVLLVLSLIVQSIQEAVKKFFKLKSRQIQESLKDLFENVIGHKEEEFLNRSRSLTGRMLRLLPFVPSKPSSPPALKMFEAVMKEFRQLGRVSAASNKMLSSISKEDLMKILRRVGPGSLLPGFVERLEKACQEFTKLKEALEAVTPILNGQAGVEYARLRETLAPLLGDLQMLFKEGAFNPELLLSDVSNLRNIKLSEALELIEVAKKGVDEELAATPAPDDERKQKLAEAKQGLDDIANYLNGLIPKLEAELSPLRLKLAEVENWYDTVMQSFEERYSRAMKTSALFIGLIVTVSLNANIFGIYRDIAGNPEKRNAILQNAEKAKNSFQEQKIKKITEDTATATKKVDEAATTAAANAASPDEKEKIEEKVKGDKTNLENEAKNEIEKIIKDTKDAIKRDADIYSEFGFTSLAEDWKALGDKKGAEALWQGVYMLLGWALMIALLSVGAPFWNDTLQSLFGVKNLLQKKGEIKNTEQKAGEGQPKS